MVPCPRSKEVHIRFLLARLASVCIAVALLASCGVSSFKLNCFLLCGPESDNLGGSISGLVGSRLQLQNNTTPGEQYNGPAANGASVIFATSAPNASYNVTVAVQPTNPSQTCIVANGTGTSPASANVTNISVTCTTNPPRFLYVTDAAASTVSGFSVDATNGTLTLIAGSPFAAGNRPVSIAVDPTGTYAYVANQTGATVSAYTIDRASGALTPVSGSPYPTGGAPTSVAIDPSSAFLYVTSGSTATGSRTTIQSCPAGHSVR